MLKVFIIFIILICVAARIYVMFGDKIKFFITGLDKGFKYSEISLLWKLAIAAQLDEPTALFFSVPALNNAITVYISDAKDDGRENTEPVQNFLTKLYKFRTRINIEHENRKGIESTRFLEKGQRLRIIYPGKGVFSSEIMATSSELLIRAPLQNGLLKIPAEDWVEKDISVYFWRKGDASYVFDSRAFGTTTFLGQTALKLPHSNNLLRTQKRKSVRGSCNIFAQLYFLNSSNTDYNAVETQPGYKCLLEDISEAGAMIRVGGRGKNDMNIKIQFTLNDHLIVMFGVVRAVEYNKVLNQSRLHFESLHIEESMKNDILSFVYNVLPEEKREILEALSLTEEDASQDENAPAEKEGEAYEEMQADEKHDFETKEDAIKVENLEDFSEVTQELPQTQMEGEANDEILLE